MKKNLIASIACAVAFATPITGMGAGPDDPFGAKVALENKPGTDPVEHYLSSSAFSYMICSMTFNLAKTSAQLSNPTSEDVAKSDYRRCVKEHSDTIKTNYSRASKAASKKPVLAKELKEHYILALDQMQGIVPGTDERVIDYERRTEAQKRATAKQLIRVKAEMP